VNVLFAASDSFKGSLRIGVCSDRLTIRITGSLTVYKHVTWRIATGDQAETQLRRFALHLPPMSKRKEKKTKETRTKKVQKGCQAKLIKLSSI